MSRATHAISLLLILGACGDDDGVRHLPDAPRTIDAALLDAPPIDAPVMIVSRARRKATSSPRSMP